MSRPATTRLKVNPPLGTLPVLQYQPPAALDIDPEYQRSMDSSSSQTLVRKIAQHWNWDLCQPLVVSRRDDGSMFVIDGQHRLAAAKLRGDISVLPCVVTQFSSVADEAASFVHLNQQRRPLTKLDIFKAALASEDTQTQAIVAAMAEAGLSIAPHSNYVSWKPGMMSNIAGIERAWQMQGAAVASAALLTFARAFGGEVLRYAGTIFPGVVAVVAAELSGLTAQERRDWVDDEFAAMLAEWIGGTPQNKWRGKIAMEKANNPNLKHSKAAEAVFVREWNAYLDSEGLGE